MFEWFKQWWSHENKLFDQLDTLFEQEQAYEIDYPSPGRIYTDIRRIPLPFPEIPEKPQGEPYDTVKVERKQRKHKRKRFVVGHGGGSFLG